MLKPLRDQIIVKRSKPLDVSPGGIIIANPSTESMNEGDVLAVGSGHVLENGGVVPLEVKVGDKVFFTKNYAEIKRDGETYLILREDSILAVLAPPAS